ncbi:MULTISPECIES: SymE family type I addiction module toxin [unclassified Gilliamella]|uniref:SymE family type I addiction module toxin n=1 Tax=unclassified Gilliamella TaxID=2685620 RepID=UPI003A5CD617
MVPVSNRFWDLSAVEARWFYTIGYVPQGTKPNPRPQLTIKGRWLEQFGFYTRRPVIIKS